MMHEQAKLLVAKRAIQLVSDGMKVGLGTGSTAIPFIHELATAVRNGLKIEAIATSNESEALARQLGIPITNFSDSPMLDLNVDGADEIGPGLSLIKGGHGAHLREKIVASAARRFVIIADESKVVSKLGKFPLPVEVIQMALPLVERQLHALGLNPILRKDPKTSGTWMTDEGNAILDCHCGVIEDPHALAGQIRDLIGVVEHGLFIDMASMALVAGDGGVRELHP